MVRLSQTSCEQTRLASKHTPVLPGVVAHEKKATWPRPDLSYRASLPLTSSLLGASSGLTDTRSGRARTAKCTWDGARFVRKEWVPR